MDPRDEEGLHKTADRLGFPLAVKAESPQIVHKTEAGAVMLDIKSKAELATAVRQVMANVARHAPGATVSHILLEKMLPPGLELLVGGMRDEQFGPAVAFGLGGVWVEAIKDAVFGIVPMTHEEMTDMIAETRADIFLRGFRNSPALDREAVIKVITAVSGILTSFPQVRELDLNPVRVYAHGAVVLDVRILLSS